MLDQFVRRSLVACVVLTFVGRSVAQCPEEPTLQHWTGAGTTVCPCFVAGEEWGAVVMAASSPPQGARGRRPPSQR